MDNQWQDDGVRQPHVLVLMATYNGERYLSEQIESVLKQGGVEVNLLIVDDCSTDGSFQLAQEYAQTDGRVVSKCNESNAGVGMNFLNMVYGVDPDKYDYIAFSDQDDVWLGDKLAVACKKIELEEAKRDAKRVDPFGIPVLYCSDLQNVDAELNNPVLELQALGLKHEKKALPLMRNFYSGCTMVMNQAMVKLFQSYRINEAFRIHDVWMALVGRYCANFIIDEEHACILRRISGENVAGAIVPGVDIANASASHLKQKAEGRCSKTARQLYEGFGQYMSSEDREMVKSFSEYRESIFGRISWAIRLDYSASTMKETLLLRLKLLFGRF